MSNIFKYIFFILIAVAVGINVFVGFNYYMPNLGGIITIIAGLLGSATGAYILAWIVWKIGFKKKQGYLLGCFAIVFLIATMGRSLPKIKEITLIHNIKNELVKRYTRPPTNDDLSKYNNQNESASYCKLDPLIKLETEKDKLDREDWEKLGSEILKIQKIIPSVKALLNTDKLKTALNQTEIALNCLNEMERAMLDRLHNFPKEIEKSNMDKAQKKAVLKGFMDNIKDGEALLIKALNARRNELKEVANYYNFLLSKEHAYTVMDNFLIFADEKARIQNNQYMQNMNLYLNEFLEAIDTTEQFTAKKLEEIKSY